MYLYTKLITVCMALTAITRYNSVHKSHEANIVCWPKYNTLQQIAEKQNIFLKTQCSYKILVKIIKTDSHNTQNVNY